jgi:hypothetical protein
MSVKYDSVSVAVDSVTFPPFTSKQFVAIKKTCELLLFGEVMAHYTAVWAYSKFLEFVLAVHALLCSLVHHIPANAVLLSDSSHC